MVALSRFYMLNFGNVLGYFKGALYLYIFVCSLVVTSDKFENIWKKGLFRSILWVGY